MSERLASLRKRPAAVLAPQDSGSRAKRAASAFLLAGGINLREVADEYGVECAHVHVLICTVRSFESRDRKHCCAGRCYAET